MKYMVLIASDGETWAGIDEAEQGQIYGRILAWWEERSAAGQILEGHQLQPVETATTVRVDRDGGATVTDGPFVEAKEMVGGYAIIDVPDLDAAIALVRTWPAPDLLEIRPLVVSEGMGT
ncbi:MAG: YciI family protein [Chloroflexota bacterium]